MSFFAKLFSTSAFTGSRNLTTEFARQRFSGTMPGETGARAASRYGIML